MNQPSVKHARLWLAAPSLFLRLMAVSGVNRLGPASSTRDPLILVCTFPTLFDCLQPRSSDHLHPEQASPHLPRCLAVCAASKSRKRPPPSSPSTQRPRQPSPAFSGRVFFDRASNSKPSPVRKQVQTPPRDPPTPRRGLPTASCPRAHPRRAPSSPCLPRHSLASPFPLPHFFRFL